ncbi:MAG: hypothetical protein RR341_08175 [Bacteroidales bacterium]
MEKLIIPTDIYYLFNEKGYPFTCAGGIPTGSMEMTAEQAEFYKNNPCASGNEVKALVLNSLPASELREKRYEVEIPRHLLDAYVSYTAEGKITEATEIAAEISAIKAKIRKDIPDE